MSTTSDRLAKPPSLLGDMLREVSRSFYLTLRIMPASVRSQLGVAYLIARAADTIADTEVVPAEQRLELLQAVRQRVRAPDSGPPLPLQGLIPQQDRPAEGALLQHLEQILSLLAGYSAEDQQRIRQVIDMIISGQVLDLERFGRAVPDQVSSLADDEELDDYLYRVAGCVGEFWTKLCRAHVTEKVRGEEASLLAQGIRFGKGLQLTNILRDMPEDLRRGRCYLPRKRLATAGLAATDLREASVFSRLLPVYRHYLQTAEDHLQAGWAYTQRWPWIHPRLRLACAWPILIGLQTLRKLDSCNILAVTAPVKISRCQVRGLLFRSVIKYPLPTAWSQLATFSRKV